MMKIIFKKIKNKKFKTLSNRKGYEECEQSSHSSDPTSYSLYHENLTIF